MSLKLYIVKKLADSFLCSVVWPKRLIPSHDGTTLTTELQARVKIILVLFYF